MSPLARPLLALAAILAIATILPQCNAYCSELDVGSPGNSEIVLKSVHVKYPGGDVTYDKMICDSRLEVVCGEHIVACNTNKAGPPPTIHVEENFQPIRIYSDYSGADVTTTVHCCND